MSEIRFMTVGDTHIYGGIDSNNSNRLKRVVNLANQAYSQGKLDFIALVGDIADMSDNNNDLANAKTILSGLNSNLVRYTAAGNHDVIDSPCITTCPTGNDQSCRFKTYIGVYPEQNYKFTKSGKIFNIIIPGICVKGASWDVPPNWYFNFNNPDIDKTLPTFIIDHGPVYKFSNWDNFDMYAQSMSSELNKFSNLIGIYAGHVHQDTNNMVGSTRQVTNQATQSTEFVGYTRVNDNNTTNYALVRYQNGNSQAPFVDPFPSPVTKYRCTGSPNWQCVEDPNGPYNSLAECQNACKEPVVKYRCTGSPNWQCVEDPNGPYNSLAECQAACMPQTKKFIVNSIGTSGALVMKSSRGDHTADEACKDMCEIIKKIN